VNKLNRITILALLTAVLLSLSLGCSKDDEIRVSLIPKERSGLAQLRQDPKSTSNSPTESIGQPTRMVVAIFQHSESTWFFKISGPAEQVAATENSWRPFFDTIKFDGNKPSWDMPSDWATGAEKPMRSPTNLQNLDTTIKNESSDYLLFDKTGRGSGKMTPPFAGGAQPPRQPVGPPAQTPTQQVKFEAPAGWDTGSTNSMVRVRLTKEADGKKAQITVIEMPASANTWEPNVQRWQNQVGLGELADSDLSARVSEISVDGVKGKIVDLIDLSSSSDVGTIAAMVKLGDSAWFLKLSGNKNLVDENRDSFKSFLNTLQLK